MVGIYVNKTKDHDFKTTKVLIDKLKQQNVEFKVFHELKSHFSYETFDLNSIKDLEVIIVLGGDGTILSLVSEISKTNCLILGVNIGNMGFLTEFSRAELDNVVNLVKDKNYGIETREMLSLTINDENFDCLNEFVLTRDNSITTDRKTIDIKAYVDNQLLDKFVADGIIVSTPTGSTAYSLSAGGPVLSPTIKGFLLTSICPHSLHNRPIVFSNNDKLCLRIENLESKVIVLSDGKILKKLNGSCEFIIQKSPKVCRFIRLKNHNNFYDKLRTKLNKWSGI